MCEGKKLQDNIALKLGCRVREKSCSDIKKCLTTAIEGIS